MTPEARIARLTAALEPFRHMRCIVDWEDKIQHGNVMGLFLGKRVCIGYARNDVFVDELNRAFERVRAALEPDDSALLKGHHAHATAG